MIISRIIPYSGLGNQMFMYAAGLSVSKRLGVELKLGAIDFAATTTEGRPYHLGCFPEITEPCASQSETFKMCPGQAIIERLHIDKPFKDLGVLRYAVKRSLRLFSYGLYKPSYVSYSPDFLNIKDNTLILGYWESEKIFSDITELVRKKFTFSPECFSPELSAKVKTCNSVAIHIRMGDKAEKNPVHFPSDGRYIKLAIEKILSLTENPSFFVFSDNIEWCRTNLPLIHDTEYTFVEGQTPPQDMALMSLCRHVIMGPSTFSWWGAWLNEYPGKIIIAPDVNLWFKPGSYDPEDRKYLLPERWIKIQ